MLLLMNMIILSLFLPVVGGWECRVAPSFCSIGRFHGIGASSSRQLERKPKLELCRLPKDGKMEAVDNLNGLRQTDPLFYQERNEVPVEALWTEN